MYLYSTTRITKCPTATINKYKIQILRHPLNASINISVISSDLKCNAHEFHLLGATILHING